MERTNRSDLYESVQVYEELKERETDVQDNFDGFASYLCRLLQSFLYSFYMTIRTILNSVS